MQVLPTAPSPTVTHLMNLVTLISPGPGLGLLLPLRPALASSHSHSQYEQAAAAASGSEKQQQAGRKGQRQRQGARTEWLPRFACLLQEGRPLTSPRSTPRHAKQQSQDRDRQGRKAKAPHRHRPAASLKNSPLAAGCLAVLCALLAAATAGLGRRGVNARPQDTGQGGRRAGQDSAHV